MHLTEKIKSLLLEDHQETVFISQNISDWKGEYALPCEISNYYEVVGPKWLHIDLGFIAFDFPPLAELWSQQGGYYWDTRNNIRINNWNTRWLILADSDGDPLIYEIDTGHILFDRHGRETWNPVKLFDNLECMLTCLCILASFIKDAGDEIAENDFIIPTKYVEKMRHYLIEMFGETASDCIISTFEITSE